MSKNEHAGRVGSDFDDFLAEEGILEEVEAAALKRLLAWQVEQAMEQQHITKVVLAKRMRTSRSAVDRLLDPSNPGVTISTLHKAATAIGKHLQVSFGDEELPPRPLGPQRIKCA